MGKMMTPAETAEFEKRCNELLSLCVSPEFDSATCEDLVYYSRVKRGGENQYSGRRFIVDDAIKHDIASSIGSSMKQLALNDEGEARSLCWFDEDQGSDRLYILPTDEVGTEYGKMMDAASARASEQKPRDVMDNAIIQRCKLNHPASGAIYVFSKVAKQSSLRRKWVTLNIEGDSVVAGNPNVLHFVHRPDAIECDGLMVIFNRQAFESAFAYKSALVGFIDTHVQPLIQAELIEGADGFVEACKRNSRRMQKLKAFLLRGDLDRLKECSSEFERVSAEFNLPLTVKDKRIVFESNNAPEQAEAILRLISKLCVVDALTGDRMYASGIENPDISVG